MESRLICKYFEKEITLIAFIFRKIRSPKTWLDKCLKSPFSEDPSTSNVADVPKHCSNLHHSIFFIFTDHWLVNWVRKSFSCWHAQSWDCLLTHWVRMKSILFLIERIERYQFRCNYLRKKTLFLNLWLNFRNPD